MSGETSASSHGGAGRAVVGLIDQVLYSLTNFVLTILVARHADARQFGTFAVLVATFLIASGVNRGLTSEPLLIRFSTKAHDLWLRATVAGIALAFSFGAVAGGALVTVSLTILPQSFVGLGLVFGAAMPTLFVQDFLRYAAMAHARPVMALLNDATVFIVQVTMSLALLFSGTATSIGFALVWAIAGTIGAVVGLLGLHISYSPARWSTIFAQWDLAARLGLDNLVTQLTQQGTSYLVGAIAGLNATAGLRAGQTFYVPPSTLATGVQSSVVPELVRIRSTSLRRMRLVLLKVSAGLSVFGTLYAALALICPDSLGIEFFGSSWHEARPLLLFLGLAQIGGGLANLAVTGLRALGDARRTLSARAVGVATVVISVLPGAVLGGARGASIALAIAGGLQAVIWWFFFGQSYRATRHAEAVDNANRRWQRLVDHGIASQSAPDAATSDVNTLGATRESTAWATALMSDRRSPGAGHRARD